MKFRKLYCIIHLQYSSEGKVLYLFFAANPKKPATFDAKKRMMDAAASSGFLCAELEERAPVAGEDGILIVIGGDGSFAGAPKLAIKFYLN